MAQGCAVIPKPTGNENAEYRSNIQTGNHTPCPQRNPDRNADFTQSIGSVPKKYRRTETPDVKTQD
jgi:hypothetical protein